MPRDVTRPKKVKPRKTEALFDEAEVVMPDVLDYTYFNTIYGDGDMVVIDTDGTVPDVTYTQEEQRKAEKYGIEFSSEGKPKKKGGN